jgi:acyl-CoA thioester hydrolase
VTGEAAIRPGECGPLRLLRATVLPEWVDYNGHMSEPYYVLVFGNASDAFYDHIGMDDATRRATATSIYTVEAHINYLQEVLEGERLLVETRLLKHDSKRIHLYHAMLREDDERLLATTELMLLHVDKKVLKVSSFLPDPAARLAEIAAAQAKLPAPPYAGRSIGLA